MRNNHDKKNYKLVKRTFALCLALAVICSCLLPVFATGDGISVMLPDTDVAVQPGGEIAMPVIPGDGADDSGAADSGSTGSTGTPVTDPSSVAGVTFPEGATNIVKNPNGSYSYDTAYGRITVFPDADKVDMSDVTVKPNPNLKQDDAAFGVLPIEYHFWLKKMDSFDLDDLAWEAEMANLSETEYLSLYGSSKEFPIWHMDTISADDVMGNYTFANPTSLNDPEGQGREFAGWYIVDSLGVESEFEFYKSYGDESNIVINVYAKWKDASGDVVEEPEQPKTDDGKSEETKDDTKQEETKDETRKNETAKAALSAEAALPDTDAKATVTVEGMPANATHLSVTAMGDSSMENFYNLYTELGGKLMPMLGFKITPKDAGGNTVQPNGYVTVTISGLGDLGLESLSGIKVLHQTADNKVETLDALYDSATGTLTFLTNSFSPFVIAYAGEEQESKDEAKTQAATTTAPLYLYALMPGVEWSEDLTKSNTYWYGIGIAQIDESAFKAKNFTNNETFDKTTINNMIGNGISLTGYSGSYKYTSTVYGAGDLTKHYSGISLFPYINVKTGSVKAMINASERNDYYQYWDGQGDQPEGKYYTIEWMHLGKPYGAPESGYNKPAVTEGTAGDSSCAYLAYHLDARITLSDMYNVDFEVLNPNETTFKRLDEETYSQTVSKGTSITKIVQPQNRSGKPYDTNQFGSNYTFDGWYKDKEFKVKADFTGSDRITENTVYYGRYVPITTSLTITKEVTGLLGDKHGTFNFTVAFAEGTDITHIKATKKSASSEEPTPVNDWKSFTLQDGETITFTGVPIGAVMTVTETAPGNHYTVKATGQTDVSGKDDASFTYKIVAASDATTTAKTDATTDYVTATNNAITITNDADLIPDSGVLLDTLPYIVILAVVVGGGVLLVLRKRRKDDED